MRVTFYGVRGSLPTTGPSTVRYGGNSVCVEVRLADGTVIILDSGTGIRELGKHLIQQKIKEGIHLLITHAHWDHIIGLPFFAPLYVKGSKIIYHPFTVRGRTEAINPTLFDGIHFPVRHSDLPSPIERDDSMAEELRLGSAVIRHIDLNHPGGAIGFRIDDADGASVCYLTDNELHPPGVSTTTPAELARFAHGTSLLIHDSQYLPEDMPAKHGWGHSLVHQVIELGRNAEARTVALHHHDPERDDDELDAVGTAAQVLAQACAPKMQTLVAREGLQLDLTPG